MSGLYVASKTRHAHLWRSLRNVMPVCSTWIDEAGPGESKNLADLWDRCIREASAADAVLVYCAPGEILKGAFVELGAALASGVPVFAVGLDGSVSNHRGIRKFDTIADAMVALRSVGM